MALAKVQPALLALKQGVCSMQYQLELTLKHLSVYLLIMDDVLQLRLQYCRLAVKT